MPANLPPQYIEAERNFRSAKSALEKIAALEEMLAIMPKHKGTDHLRAELRARIAKLNQSLDKKTATQRASMIIEKVGAAQVVITGLPNTGKSQLVSNITNASPAVAAYPFTTHVATPGMMPFENIQIQLVDTPPLTEQPVEWWLPPMFRRADALMVLVDLSKAPLTQMETIMAELEKMRVSVSEEKTEEAETFSLSRKKVLIVGNKMDLDNHGKNCQALRDKYGNLLPGVAISATERKGFDELKLKTYQVLEIIRVYTKVPGQKPDSSNPIVLDKGSMLEDAAASVHKDFAARMKYARIWGSGKHDGIMAKRDHVLQDGDVIELHL